MALEAEEEMIVNVHLICWMMFNPNVKITPKRTMIDEDPEPTTIIEVISEVTTEAILEMTTEVNLEVATAATLEVATEVIIEVVTEATIEEAMIIGIISIMILDVIMVKMKLICSMMNQIFWTRQLKRKNPNKTKIKIEMIKTLISNLICWMKVLLFLSVIKMNLKMITINRIVKENLSNPMIMTGEITNKEEVITEEVEIDYTMFIDFQSH